MSPGKILLTLKMLQQIDWHHATWSWIIFLSSVLLCRSAVLLRRSCLHCRCSSKWVGIVPPEVGSSSCHPPFSVALHLTRNHFACTADVPADGSAPSNLEVEHLPVVSLQPGGEDNYVIGESVVCHSLILGQESTQLLHSAVSRLGGR